VAPTAPGSVSSLPTLADLFIKNFGAYEGGVSAEVKAGTHVSSISNLAIWDNHSSTQDPDFYNAKIEGKPATEIIKDESWLRETFIPMVQQRGAAIIKARGASSAASAANAAIDTIWSLVHPTPASDWHSVAVCSDGSYGVEKGLISSFPHSYCGLRVGDCSKRGVE